MYITQHSHYRYLGGYYIKVLKGINFFFLFSLLVCWNKEKE